MPTASGDPHDQISAFYGTMERRGCVPSSISLFRLGDRPIDFAEHLLAQDAIYVTGGSMVNLLALWREHGIDEIMREAHARGILLCGYSAGSMCWFEAGRLPRRRRAGGLPGNRAARGQPLRPLLAGSGSARRLPQLIGAGEIPAGLALDDHAAALIRDGELVEAVRATETASAFRVERSPARRRGRRNATARPACCRPPPAGPEPGLAEMRELRRMQSERPSGPGRLGRRLMRVGRVIHPDNPDASHYRSLSEAEA